MRQVPNEVGHDASNHAAADQLEESHGMEHKLRVMRRRGFRAAIEWVEHGVWFPLLRCIRSRIEKRSGAR